MQGLAIAIVRGWTRIYTWGMDPRAAEIRIAEIESDLWESEHAGEGAAAMLLRLVFGVYDDVVWRTSHDLVHERGSGRTAAIGAIVTLAAIFAAWWVIDAGHAGQLPAPPTLKAFVRGPTPPPPPPPPPRRQEIRRTIEQEKKE